MKKSLFLIACTFLVLSCAKDSDFGIDTSLHSHDIETNALGKAVKVDVCHQSGNGSWSIKSINENALPQHLGHGDVLLTDDDGDGYVIEFNECLPGGDCDDDNVDVNPGSEEICENAIDDNCDGNISEGCCPYWTLEEILAGTYVLWFDYRDQDCLLNGDVGFAGQPCNFGYRVGEFFRGVTDCEFYEWDESLVAPCDEILLAAQAILQEENWCNPPGDEIKNSESPFTETSY